jgi:hypothetical protein
MNIRPPDVKEAWDDNDIWTQALLISYSQIRDIEEGKLREAMAKAGIGLLR